MNQYTETERTIQRLVDNQLDHADRERFLRAAEHHPELWRQLALAFVEDRVWASAMGSSPFVNNLAGRESALESVATSGTTRKSPLRQPGWMALAVTALLAITVAIRLASLPDSERPVGVISAPDTSLAAEPYVLEMDNGKLQIPLYQQLAPLRDQLAQLETGIDPGLQQQFHNAGFELNPDVRYITGNAPDGRSFIVPVHQFHIQSRIQ